MDITSFDMVYPYMYIITPFPYRHKDVEVLAMMARSGIT